LFTGCFLSTVLAGQRLGIKEVDEGIWLASFMGRFLSKAAERRKREAGHFGPAERPANRYGEENID
jgi:hypothetical protein